MLSIGTRKLYTVGAKENTSEYIVNIFVRSAVFGDIQLPSSPNVSERSGVNMDTDIPNANVSISFSV